MKQLWGSDGDLQTGGRPAGQRGEWWVHPFEGDCDEYVRDCPGSALCECGKREKGGYRGREGVVWR